MTECDAITKLVEQWEDQGLVAPVDFDVISAHIDGCAQCDYRYSALMPLLARDSREGNESAEPTDFNSRTTDLVMERIHGAAPRRLMIPTWASLVAACLLVAVGIGVGAVITKSGPTATSEMVAVSFSLDAPDASSVALVGNFNDWDPSQLMMKDPDHSGTWQITVLLPRNSTAVYNFVINGSKWVTDPRSTAQVNDGFGGKSSVLRL